MHASITPVPNDILAAGNIKLSESDESGRQLNGNVRIDKGSVDYVRGRMHREVVTCEVLGKAILFDREIDSWTDEIEVPAQRRFVV